VEDRAKTAPAASGVLSPRRENRSPCRRVAVRFRDLAEIRFWMFTAFTACSQRPLGISPPL